MLIAAFVLLFVAMCLTLAMVVVLRNENAWLDLRCNNLRKDVLRQGVAIEALEKDIDSIEDRIFKLEEKFEPVGFTVGSIEDIKDYPWSDPQYVWPNIGYAEISSTLDRQSGPPVA